MNIHEKIAILRSAKESALFREHTPKLVSYKNHKMHYKCENCHMTMVINFEPKPNEIDIGGEMVALNCAGKTYYAVNFNPVGYLPESDPYEGLENVDDIMSAIDDICYLFEDSEGIDANNELPDKKTTKHFLESLIAGNKLEHETIGYIGNFCIFVYKDDEYEYRQSK